MTGRLLHLPGTSTADALPKQIKQFAPSKQLSDAVLESFLEHPTSWVGLAGFWIDRYYYQDKPRLLKIISSALSLSSLLVATKQLPGWMFRSLNETLRGSGGFGSTGVSGEVQQVSVTHTDKDTIIYLQLHISVHLICTLCRAGCKQKTAHWGSTKLCIAL